MYTVCVHLIADKAEKASNLVCTHYVYRGCTPKERSKVSNVTRVITGRVRNEIAEIIDKECEQTGKSRGKVIEEAIECKGEANYGVEFQGLYNRLIFATLNADVEDLCKILNEKIDRGEILISDSGISFNSVQELELKDFYSACEEKDLDPQEQINKLTRSIWNMRTGGAGGA